MGEDKDFSKEYPPIGGRDGAATCFDFLLPDLTLPIHVNGLLIRKLSQHLQSRENSAQ